MRASCGLLSWLMLVGVVAAGCGKVKAIPADAAASIDAPRPQPDGPAAACVANAMSCMADALYQCSADGSTDSKIEDCQYGCTTDHCNQCAANTTFCNGDSLAQCDASGTITNPMTCDHGCQMDRCNTCTPGSQYCSGTTAITCAMDGTPGSSMDCGTPGCAGGVCNSCAPSTTSCQGDTLVVCNAAGAVASATPCALGCGTSPNAHCKALVPSYGVSAPSGALPNLDVNADATLDITNCSGAPNSVQLTIGANSMSLVGAPQVSVVNQSGGPPICVVRFGTITVEAGFTLTVVNSASAGHMLSLGATGDIQIAGTIAFTNAANGSSPGGTVMSLGTNSNSQNMAPGGGGAGNALAGGAGGQCTACSGSSNVPGGAGGAAVATITTKLTGGSVGGNVLLTDGTTVHGYGGLGGGGLQLVSLTRVTLAATGVVNLNGGGGYGYYYKFTNDNPAGGGGSGGSLVVEAPVVNLSAGAIAAANGGGGAGGCSTCTTINGIPRCFHVNGQGGQLATTRAAGGDCPGYGDGGYAATGVALPSVTGASSDSGAATASGGGGGGADGFIILRGRAAGSVTLVSGSIVSPAPTVGAVTAQ